MSGSINSTTQTEPMSTETDELLDALNDVAGKHARSTLIEHKMNLMPTWVLVTKNQKIEIVGTPWADDREKGRYAAKLRSLMRLKGVMAYSFVTEAWTATVEPGEWDPQTDQPLDGLRASQRPDRQEVVIACACTRERTRWRQWRIIREATTERIIDLKDKPLPESDQEPEGWLAEMLR